MILVVPTTKNTQTHTRHSAWWSMYIKMQHYVYAHSAFVIICICISTETCLCLFLPHSRLAHVKWNFLHKYSFQYHPCTIRARCRMHLCTWKRATSNATRARSWHRHFTFNLVPIYLLQRACACSHDCSHGSLSQRAQHISCRRSLTYGICTWCAGAKTTFPIFRMFAFWTFCTLTYSTLLPYFESRNYSLNACRVIWVLSQFIFVIKTESTPPLPLA